MTSTQKHTIAERFEAYRVARGLSQRAVADALSAALSEEAGRVVPFAQSQVDRIGRGERSIRAEELPAIARTLGVTPAQLVSEAGVSDAAVQVLLAQGLVENSTKQLSMAIESVEAAQAVVRTIREDVKDRVAQLDRAERQLYDTPGDREQLGIADDRDDVARTRERARAALGSARDALR